jgi:hypothetical protein
VREEILPASTEPWPAIEDLFASNSAPVIELAWSFSGLAAARPLTAAGDGMRLRPASRRGTT